ncbi:hypothetical protein GMA11_06900 [Granulicatella sp. zg-ZJ]|uniref:hypothetical protein n=1 Tax=Granulicatella sp. zg-ZJ TaxID=2678504 RepID=UPI0013D31DD0|nr:hypothetical protein [Granulicatella sp. zg-ZJ]NEW63122.1 hypothetical protein [Granulicatella sp. zg-ZJ]
MLINEKIYIKKLHQSFSLVSPDEYIFDNSMKKYMNFIHSNKTTIPNIPSNDFVVYLNQLSKEMPLLFVVYSDTLTKKIYYFWNGLYESRELSLSIEKNYGNKISCFFDIHMLNYFSKNIYLNAYVQSGRLYELLKIKVNISVSDNINGNATAKLLGLNLNELLHLISFDWW